MGTIIVMEDFRRRRQLERLGFDPESGEFDYAADPDIWGRDYGRADNQLWAVFTIRELLSRHMPFHEEWKHYLLCLLSALHGDTGAATPGGDMGFEEAAQALITFIDEETAPNNWRDLRMAKLLMGLAANAKLRRHGAAD